MIPIVCLLSVDKCERPGIKKKKRARVSTLLIVIHERGEKKNRTEKFPLSLIQ
jgi:hypothetical protein